MTCQQSQTRDGDKSKLRDKGILKAVLIIIDVIAHKLLVMDVWEQAEIDKTMVETPCGTNNERSWSGANSSANSVAEDMISEIEVNDVLKFGHLKDLRRDVCNAGDVTGFLRECSSTVKRRIPSPSLLSWIRVSCHVANEESLHVPCSSRFPRMSNPNLVRKLVVVRNVQLTWNQACLWFVARREDDTFDDGLLKVFCACWSLQLNNSLLRQL